MHEKILQGVTVGVVAGLFVYWLTSDHHADYAGKNSSPNSFRPVYGCIRETRGRGTCADCQCCGLPAPETTTNPLASDYLDCAPPHAAAISKWNVGVSLQVTCEGIDLHSCITRKETGTSFPYGVEGPNTVAKPVRVPQQIQCNPNSCSPGNCCSEVI